MLISEDFTNQNPPDLQMGVLFSLNNLTIVPAYAIPQAKDLTQNRRSMLQDILQH